MHVTAALRHGPAEPKTESASEGDWPRRYRTGQEALLSKELLYNVGQFLYGEQWQASLSRDIGVGERSLRRWVAGTDRIPNGVWRDIGLRLESLRGDLQYLCDEVNRTCGLVEVHS